MNCLHSSLVGGRSGSNKITNYLLYYDSIVAGSCIIGRRSLLLDLILLSIIDFVLFTCRFMYGRRFTNKSTAFSRRAADAALEGKNVKESVPIGGGI